MDDHIGLKFLHDRPDGEWLSQIGTDSAHARDGHLMSAMGHPRTVLSLRKYQARLLPKRPLTPVMGILFFRLWRSYRLTVGHHPWTSETFDRVIVRRSG